MKRLALVAVVAGLVLSTYTIASANIIFADNFNSENGGFGALNYYGFANWTVTDGSVDLIGDGTEWNYLPTGNGLYVDLDGSTYNAGVMTTKNALSLGPGLYELSFYLGGNQWPKYDPDGDSVIVKTNIGSYSETFDIASTAPLTQFKRTFYLSSPISVTLSFENLGGDNVGAILDNVQLAAIPEPASFSLLGLGLFGLLRKRRRG